MTCMGAKSKKKQDLLRYLAAVKYRALAILDSGSYDFASVDVYVDAAIDQVRRDPHHFTPHPEPKPNEVDRKE